MYSGPSAGWRAHFGCLPRCSSNLYSSSCSLSIHCAGQVFLFPTVNELLRSHHHRAKKDRGVSSSFHCYSNVLMQSFVCYLHAQRSLCVWKDRPSKGRYFVCNLIPCCLYTPTTPTPTHMHSSHTHSRTHACTHTRQVFLWPAGGERGARCQLLKWQTWLHLLSQSPVIVTSTQSTTHTAQASVGHQSALLKRGICSANVWPRKSRLCCGHSKCWKRKLWKQASL